MSNGDAASLFHEGVPGALLLGGESALGLSESSGLKFERESRVGAFVDDSFSVGGFPEFDGFVVGAFVVVVGEVAGVVLGVEEGFFVVVGVGVVRGGGVVVDLVVGDGVVALVVVVGLTGVVVSGVLSDLLSVVLLTLGVLCVLESIVGSFFESLEVSSESESVIPVVVAEVVRTVLSVGLAFGVVSGFESVVRFLSGSSLEVESVVLAVVRGVVSTVLSVVLFTFGVVSGLVVDLDSGSSGMSPAVVVLSVGFLSFGVV